MSDQINNTPAYNEAWKDFRYHSGKFVRIDWEKASKEYWKHVQDGNFWTNLEEENEPKQ